MAKPFIPDPYNWKTYGDMNIEFWEKHQNTSSSHYDWLMKKLKEHQKIVRKNKQLWIL